MSSVKLKLKVGGVKEPNKSILIEKVDYTGIKSIRHQGIVSSLITVSGALIHKDYPEKEDNSNYSLMSYGSNNPTGNCQMSILGAANQVLSYDKANAIAMLKEFQKLSMKNILMMDIQKGYIPSVKAIFDSSEIIGIFEYVSTNGSSMAICLVKTANILSK